MSEPARPDFTSSAVHHNGIHGADNVAFRCSKCDHWALAPAGKTLCYICEGVQMEEMTPAKLRELVGRDDARILEIGANDGTHTLEFLAAFPEGRVLCFECEPRAIKKWRQNVQDVRAILVESAVSDKNGIANFHPSGGKPPGKKWEHIDSWDMSGSLLQDDQHTRDVQWLKFGEPFQVGTITLDCMLCDLVPYEILWIDVQGAEAMVLRGGQKTIAKARFVILEAHPKPYYHGQATMVELIDLLPGYKFVGAYDGDNFLFERPQ